jgi:hypothetical protein
MNASTVPDRTPEERRLIEEFDKARGPAFVEVLR